MKKYLTTLLAACCMLAAFSMPASALEYHFDGPDAGLFGRPTSDDTIYVTMDKPVNTDRSKNAAYIPPVFGSPTSYKVVYKTNLSGDYRTLADNLSTSKVYVLDARPAVLGLVANERVTEVMFVFGIVPAGFAQVETPYIYATARSGLANSSGIVNVADVGGLYNGQWIQAVSRWLTTVYTKTTVKLPKTGY